MMFLFVFGLTFLAPNLIFAQTCEVEVVDGTCSSDISVCADNEYGANVTWTNIPKFSLTCAGSGESNYAFEMSFDLPSSQENCWELSNVTRIGTDAGLRNNFV